MIAPERPVVLVACSASKREHEARAWQLYTGDLFVKSRDWALRFGGVAFVLSAKHGLVPFMRQLAPYDLALSDMGRAERREWAERVAQEYHYLRKTGVISGARTVVLAGRLYREWCEGLPGFEFPLAGMGIGQQKQWLKAQLAQKGKT